MAINRRCEESPPAGLEGPFVHLGMDAFGLIVEQRHTVALLRRRQKDVVFVGGPSSKVDAYAVLTEDDVVDHALSFFSAAS